MTLSIERGEEFDQTVTVHVNPPEGRSADPEELEFGPGQKEGKLMLTATSDAVVGEELAVELEFKPETGDSITKQLTVTVTEAEEGGQ